MDKFRFIFWEVLKAVSLAFLGLVAAKAVAGLRRRGLESEGSLAVLRGVLYAAILTFVILGARTVGQDWAASLYFWAGADNLAKGQVAKAYDNALRAVQLRPEEIEYWRLLERAKFSAHQFASALGDEAAMRSLSQGSLEEEDAVRFAFCHYFLGQFDQVLPLTERMIQHNRFYFAPYVLQGMTYTFEKKYPEAEKSFLAVLQIYPTQEEAVEGLAHAYFLAGSPDRALAVLAETKKYSFPPAARQRFEDLRALYEQR
jgi:tetratricopeptide (TPR) repeat protein